MTKQIRILLAVLFITVGHRARADSGVPGLGNAMLLIGVAVFICFLLVTFAISILTRWFLNYKTGELRKNIWIIFFGTLLFSSNAFFLHGIGDLSYSPLYIAFIIVCGFIGGTIGYFLTKRENNS